MHQNNRRSQPQQRGLAKQVEKVDANHFFNLLTGPRRLDAYSGEREHLFRTNVNT